MIYVPHKSLHEDCPCCRYIYTRPSDTDYSISVLMDRIEQELNPLYSNSFTDEKDVNTINITVYGRSRRVLLQIDKEMLSIFDPFIINSLFKQIEGALNEQPQELPDELPKPPPPFRLG